MFFTREDWKLFRSIDTLSQKAGVRQEYIPSLVIKELVDNALDVSESCEIGLLENHNGFFVKEDGPGIEPESMADLFSINRPMMSTKLLRLPTRGALGNGLRVVTGAVIASGGKLYVSSGGGRYLLSPLDDGRSEVKKAGSYEEAGTKVEVIFGSHLKVGETDLLWGRLAILFNQGESCRCGSSPFWYTTDTFYELVNSFEGTVEQLVRMFQGISRVKARELPQVFTGRQCADLSFSEADTLLGWLRDHGTDVSQKKIGLVGDQFPWQDYARKTGTLTLNSLKGRFNAAIPYVVEAWVNLNQKSSLTIMVNKTPITGVVEIYDDRNKIYLYGCGLAHSVKSKAAEITINIQTPYMPITSDGKEPNLRPMLIELAGVISKATQKAKKTSAILNDGKVRNEKEIILDYLGEAINKASGEGEYKFSQRQLYYAIRPYIVQRLDKQPDYNYFCRILTEYEAEYGDIPHMYRDPRGILYHPHLSEEIPIGTISVQNYKRPSWTFNKILYSEKEGFFSILRDAKFPERYDCALLTSKGYASRAVKDLFDLLGDTDEEILFFCIHDADAAGTKIYETLQEGTLARPGRRIKVINLGLEPEEALEMGLEAESCEGKSRKPVAHYVKALWKEWLQKKRVELNAMTSPQFLNWLESKMNQYGNPKVLPDTLVINGQLKAEVLSIIKNKIASQILEEAGYEEKVSQAIRGLVPGIDGQAGSIRTKVAKALNQNREYHWTHPLQDIAKEIAEKAM